MRFLKGFYLTSRFLSIVVVIVLFFFFGYYFPILFFFSKVLLVAFLTIIIIESIILFSNKNGFFAERILADRLSNGDDNEIKIVANK